MQIARRFSALQKSHHPVALTIGSFDGVHLGHRHLFAEMSKLAPYRLVVTFETLPINYFRPELGIPMLTTPDEKLSLLKQAGIDTTLILPFTSDVANLTYQEFLTRIHSFYPFQHLVLGENATFGKDQEGNQQNIEEIAPTLNFAPHYIKKYLVDGKPLSSMRIRNKLKIEGNNV